MVLHGSRDGTAYIRATDIEAEARIRGLTPEEVPDFARLVRAMDAEWVKAARAREEKQRADAESRNRRAASAGRRG